MAEKIVPSVFLNITMALSFAVQAQTDAGTLKKEDVAYDVKDYSPFVDRHVPDRELEIPKPSWQAYDVKHYGVEMSAEVPMTVQDRAYTSPIWYTP